LEIKRFVSGKRLVLALLCSWLVLLVTRHPSIRFSPKAIFKESSYRTNVPFPPDSFQVSVVLMNHNRPYLFKETSLLPVLTSHPSVSQIIILHSNAATAFTSEELNKEEINVSKIKHVDAIAMNAEIGLAIRFHFCATDALTDWVIIMDDDMELRPAAISTMVRSMMDDPHRIVGHYGRRYDSSLADRHGYDTRNAFGKVEVVLTKAMILEKKICEQFVEQMDIVQDLVVDSRPTWNGEDIFVNLVANHYYNVHGRNFQNLAIEDLPVWDADTSKFPEDHSISGNLDRLRISEVGFSDVLKARVQADAHRYYRGKLWFTAKQRLAASE